MLVVSLHSARNATIVSVALRVMLVRDLHSVYSIQKYSIQGAAREAKIKTSLNGKRALGQGKRR